MNPARDLGPRIVTALAGWGLQGWKMQVSCLTGKRNSATAAGFAQLPPISPFSLRLSGPRLLHSGYTSWAQRSGLC
eukprot:scaffold6590_cov30-Tisochrysis_lutea.AAC.3